jgi:hypothetical protein
MFTIYLKKISKKSLKIFGGLKKPTYLRGLLIIKPYGVWVNQTNNMNKIQIGKKVGEIFETKDYSIFKFREDNRIVNQNHVKKLAQRMKEIGWLSTSIVTINGGGEVIDGQHRIKAAMSVGVPIRYKQIKGAGSDEMFLMNSLQRNWSPFDHLHKFVVKGNPHYITFDEFVKQFPMFKYTEISMLLSNSLSTIRRDTFESGEYVVKNEKKARLWTEYLLELKPYFEKYYNKSIFVRAFIKIISNKKEFVFSEFLHKVKLRPSMMVACGTVDQYVEMIETIYNYKRSNKINLRF